jgi:hypothetical protein
LKYWPGIFELPPPLFSGAMLDEVGIVAFNESLTPAGEKIWFGIFGTLLSVRSRSKTL